MYRDSSHFTTTKSHLPSPAPDELGDSDSDIYDILEKKRREVDEEIEAFISRKEQEFRYFEDELRSRKRRNTNGDTDLGVQHLSSRKSRSNNLTKHMLHTNASITGDKIKKADDINLGGLKHSLGPGKPSVSVDRVTINGMTTPPVSGTPPLGRNLSRSPTNLSDTPSHNFACNESGKSPTIHDREIDFHGLFTPSYLRLLDAKTSSLPQNSTSPSISESNCAVAAPMRSSNSLPSALRSASGPLQKRKHVTFQLAHSVVVDPNSSYEENPSPLGDQIGEELLEAKERSGTEMTQSYFPEYSPAYDPNGDLTSPNNDLNNDANFFSFDEELDDTSDEPTYAQKVSVPRE